MLLKIRYGLENILLTIMNIFNKIFLLKLLNNLDMEIIRIPNIRSDDAGFEIGFKIAKKIIENPINYYSFDFTNCSKLSHNGIVLLGGLARYVESQRSTKANLFKKKLSIFGTNFQVETMSAILSENLINNNFLSHFKEQDKFRPHYKKGEYIGYREHKNILNENFLTEYLKNEWLSNDKLILSKELKSEIISRIIEIFMNAYGHGISRQENEQLGIYSCGEYDKKLKKLHISVLDFGVGIVNNVMTGCPNISTEVEAMDWALKLGNSTNTDSINSLTPRGLGFELLREFVTVNKGELRIYSNSVKACTTPSGSYKISDNVFNFPGTLVSITINCDNRKYMFSTEAKSPHLFF